MKDTERESKPDRLVRIVDRYMPAIADENRTYVMKYPHKVLTMLKQAWKARKKIRAKRKRKKQQRGRERSSTSTETKTGMRPQAGTGDRDEYSTFATEEGDQEGATAPLAEDDDYEKETGTYSNQPPERSEGSVAGEDKADRMRQSDQRGSDTGEPGHGGNRQCGGRNTSGLGG